MTTVPNSYPGYVFPITMPCGAESRSVTSIHEASLCYETMLRDTHVDWRHTPGWNHVRERPCEVTVFAGTTDPHDEYCTIFQVSSNASTRAYTVDASRQPHVLCRNVVL